MRCVPCYDAHMDKSLVRKSAATQYGFTLAELTVVIVSVTLLAMVAASCTVSPSPVDSARAAKCRNNIRNIAEACRMYMNSPMMHRNSAIGAALPKVTPAPSSTNWGSAAKGNPSALWLLVRYKLIGRSSFVCPSAEASGYSRTPRPGDSAFTDNTLSYSYLSQVRFTDANTSAEIEITGPVNKGLRPSELAVIADANPRCRPGRQGLDNDQIGANSLNHDRVGQNVGFVDGRADWFSTTTIPDTKPLNNRSEPDDIYRSCGRGNDDADGRRGAINDAFLIP